MVFSSWHCHPVQAGQWAGYCTGATGRAEDQKPVLAGNILLNQAANWTAGQALPTVILTPRKPGRKKTAGIVT